MYIKQLSKKLIVSLAMAYNKKYQMDMCHGSLFSQIFRFSLPLMGTNIMTLMFHAADLVVLGQFAAPEVRTAATAAVCSVALAAMWWQRIWS